MPAILALPDLGLVVAGLLLLILAYALYLLRDMIVSSFSHVPFVGGWISGSLGGLIDSARDAVIRAADSTFGGAKTLFEAGSHWATTMLDNVVNTFADTIGTIVHIATVQIPAVTSLAYREVVNTEHRLQADITAAADTAYHEVVSTEERLTADLGAVADTAYHEVVNTEQRLVADIGAVADTAYQEVVSTADRLGHDIASVATTAYDEVVNTAARLEVDTQALFATAEADIVRGIDAAEAYAAGAADAARAAAIAAVSSAASTGIAAVWPGIVTDLGNLDRTIAGSWPDIRDAVDAIPRAVPADLAGALSAVAALAIPALRSMDDCVLPQCRDLGGLRSFLADLLSLGSAAALLAWLIYCVAEPATAADDTATVADPIARDTLGALERLFGITS